jgi:hypothetical protein
LRGGIRARRSRRRRRRRWTPGCRLGVQPGGLLRASSRPRCGRGIGSRPPRGTCSAEVSDSRMRSARRRGRRARSRPNIRWHRWREWPGAAQPGASDRGGSGPGTTGNSPGARGGHSVRSPSTSTSGCGYATRSTQAQRSFEDTTLNRRALELLRDLTVAQQASRRRHRRSRRSCA